MATVELIDVRKTYREVEAVKRLNLRIEEGEFFSLLGPSGCGKTTTLRMIAGFVNPTEGMIRIGGQDFTNLPPEKQVDHPGGRSRWLPYPGLISDPQNLH